MFSALAIFPFLWLSAESFPGGAPFSTCLTMFPKHGPVQAQSTPSPFHLRLHPNTYRPASLVTVTLEVLDRRPFKGLQVKAVRSSGDSESALGSFVKIAPNITKVFTCEGGYKNMVTHTAAMVTEDVNKVTLIWKAPETNVGNIVFVASFVENYETFWTGVKATLAAEQPERAVAPDHVLAEVNSAQAMARLQLERCGEDRGCFLYPRFCSHHDCQAAVSFRQDGDHHFRFELMAKDATFVSVGLSHDSKMGEDETVTCTAEGDIMSVQHGFNPKLYNQRIVRYQLSELQVNHTDGHITCSFRRPRATVTRYVNQSASQLQYVSSSYDLSQDYHVMLAWGTVKQGTDVINKHKELPPVTDGKVTFTNYIIYRGSALPVEVRIHGSLMAVAWVLVAGVTTAISRYYKHWLSNRVFCGTSIWFQIHRAAAITVGVLTASSVVLIFVKIGGFTEEYKHAILGLVVLSLAGIQILAGMLRPERGSRYRSLFKWIHMVLGLSAHTLSAVTMYLAMDIRYVPAVMRELGITVLTGWVPLQIGWTIVLELRRCCTVQQGVKKETEPWTAVVTSPDTLLLFFYCMTLLLLAAATLSVILLF